MRRRCSGRSRSASPAGFIVDSIFVKSSLHAVKPPVWYQRDLKLRAAAGITRQGSRPFASHAFWQSTRKLTVAKRRNADKIVDQFGQPTEQQFWNMCMTSCCKFRLTHVVIGRVVIQHLNTQRRLQKLNALTCKYADGLHTTQVKSRLFEAAR